MRNFSRSQYEEGSCTHSLSKKGKEKKENAHLQNGERFQIWLLGQQSLTGSGVLGFKLEWNVRGRSPLSLCLITSSSYFSLNFYFLSQQT